MNELTDRVALVTGASRGIGRAIAQRFAAEGAAVAITARSVEPGSGGHLPGSLEETAALIRDAGGSVLLVGADLADPTADLEGLAAQVTSELGPVDILVNNAAACFYLPFQEMSAKRMRIAFEVNVVSPHRLVQAVAPAMIERGEGWILNITSGMAQNPPGPPWPTPANHAQATAYGSSKAALDRLTEALAVELHGHGVRVNALAPQRAVRTEGQTAMMELPDHYFEPMEAFVEAALALVTCGPDTTALVTRSLDHLAATGRPVRTLDGSQILDGAAPGA